MQVPGKNEFLSRIDRLQQSLRTQGSDGFLVTQHIALYYLTGSMQAGFAFVPTAGDATFYVRRSVDRAQDESAVRVEPLPTLRAFRPMLERDYPQLFASGRAATIATEMDVLPAQTYAKLAQLIAGGDGSVLTDGSAMIRRLRMIKSPYEIGRIEAAAAATAEALEEATAELKEGMSELALMARIEYGLRMRGHIGLMRTRSYNMEIMTGMVGAGEAAAEPSAFDGPAGGRGLGPAAPQSVSRRLISRGEPILIDIGCCIDGYVIDQTRTAVIGSLPDGLAAAYEQSVAIIREAERLMMPGTPSELLYAAAIEQAAKAGLSANFMGHGMNQVKFLGHGIGLEVDEWPVLARGFADPLEPGMTIAVEPKFTFPGRGVVGIENSYVVTDRGPRQLTKSPEKLIVVP
ncbi:M24 family metallopeptidase [Paenibacillus spongiae]|uniref:Xaa-Pro peptidase family protein n=1 Tax=Paenibacillus spongiae TaxID=2909671 RepID=A0ABY5SJ01_9BACL|nr:Xaa-Pro peptidase family protein [Paenibacillus spongiae]UVI33563.1 Xaa-Pro peptidase family protein [Paenibacillus spongiae]